MNDSDLSVMQGEQENAVVQTIPMSPIIADLAKVDVGLLGEHDVGDLVATISQGSTEPLEALDGTAYVFSPEELAAQYAFLCNDNDGLACLRHLKDRGGAFALNVDEAEPGEGNAFSHLHDLTRIMAHPGYAGMVDEVLPRSRTVDQMPWFERTDGIHRLVPYGFDEGVRRQDSIAVMRFTPEMIVGQYASLDAHNLGGVEKFAMPGASAGMQHQLVASSVLGYMETNGYGAAEPVDPNGLFDVEQAITFGIRFHGGGQEQVTTALVGARERIAAFQGQQQGVDAAMERAPSQSLGM